jgi:hypothetical protein
LYKTATHVIGVKFIVLLFLHGKHTTFLILPHLSMRSITFSACLVLFFVVFTHASLLPRNDNDHVLAPRPTLNELENHGIELELEQSEYLAKHPHAEDTNWWYTGMTGDAGQDAEFVEEEATVGAAIDPATAPQEKIEEFRKLLLENEKTKKVPAGGAVFNTWTDMGMYTIC